MRLGILSVQTTKTGFWSKIRNPVFIKESFESPVSMTVAEFAYTAEELSVLPERRRTVLLQKGMDLLRSQHICGIVMTRDCSAVLGEGTWTAGARMTIPKARFIECVEFGLQRAGDLLSGQTVYVLDREMQTVSYQLLVNMCRHARYLCLLTAKTEIAEELADRLCDEYGAYLDIRDFSYHVPGRAAFVADVDQGTVRIGRDCIIDGLEVDVDTHGYDVDPNAVLAYLPELSEKLPFISWLSGKKRLTR